MNAPNADTDTDHYSDIRIFDTSLRDGEQSPGCGMTPTQKLRLARALADLGVDVIEAGFPASSSADLQSVSAIAGLPEMPVVAALARCQRADIEAAARALQRARRPRIHVFISTSPLHREHKLGMSREAVLERAVQGVQWAREFVDDVEFSAEDALRTEPEFLAEIYSATLAAGALTLNVPDTVGYTTPDEIRALFEYLRANVRDAAQAVFSAHCHNDLGLAVANSLAAIEGGARQVECTINGIGERAGNCALEEIVMALRVRPERYRARTAIRSEQLVPTSRLLSRITGQHVPRNKAVVGLNAFAHEAGIHQHGMLRHRGTYEIMRPEDVGFTRSELVLGRHSGRHALADRIRNLGFELDDTRFEQVFHAFKTLGEKKREIFDVDLETLVLGQQPDASRGFRLARFHVTTGAGGHALPTASVEVVGADGRRITEAAPGDGPVHALFAALARATGIHFEVSGYQVTSISGGEDAQGQASVTALVEGEEWVGRSASTDILEASAQAWLEIANRYNRCVAPVAAAVNA